MAKVEYRLSAPRPPLCFSPGLAARSSRKKCNR